jgi:hypothetical protein
MKGDLESIISKSKNRMSAQKSAEISSFLKKQRNLQIVLFFCNFADINFYRKILINK